jgi:hypothetical protein
MKEADREKEKDEQKTGRYKMMDRKIREREREEREKSRKRESRGTKMAIMKKNAR